jgi:hypothetical protein
MTSENVFNFSDYQDFLIYFFGKNESIRGLKSKFATAIECQNSFLSQVLSKKADFSLDQAYRAGRFFHFSDMELEYFELLVQKNKVADKDHVQHLTKKIEKLKQQQTKIKSQVSSTLELSQEAKAQYYSSWLYIAVHICASLKPSRTPGEIAEYLNSPLKQILPIIDFLRGHHLIDLSNGFVSMGSTHIHLSDDSFLVQGHHRNWRGRALSSLDDSRETDLHYSVVYSISREDAASLRGKFLSLIKENLKMVEPSREDILVANCIDFFELGSSK